jgi:hypothetical protein
MNVAEKIDGIKHTQRRPTRADDLAELTASVHIVQRTVMARAVARAHPKEFRLLGEVIAIMEELY